MKGRWQNIGLSEKKCQKSIDKMTPSQLCCHLNILIRWILLIVKELDTVSLNLDLIINQQL